MGYFKEQEIEQMSHGLGLDNDLDLAEFDKEFEPDLYSLSFFDSFDSRQKTSSIRQEQYFIQ